MSLPLTAKVCPSGFGTARIPSSLPSEGNVIAGFFSDEPELGNVKGYPFDNMLGQKDIRLPWSDELERKLTETWKEEFLTNLPALWYDSEEKTKKVRTE